MSKNTPQPAQDEKLYNPDEPRQLHTQGDDEKPLSRLEADVAGISVTPMVVYGDDSIQPNADDQREAHRGAD